MFLTSDDAAVEVPMEPPGHRASRRLVLIPQSQGTPGSIHDRQSDEFQGHSTGGPLRDSGREREAHHW